MQFEDLTSVGEKVVVLVTILREDEIRDVVG